MPDEYIRSLARKWQEGTATEEEIKLLLQWYGKEEEDGEDVVEDTEAKNRIRTNIWKVIQVRRSRKIVYLRMAAAAAAAVLLVTGGISYMYRSETIARPEKQQVEIYVPKTQRNKIQLPDGSVVWLNADSYLQYRINKREREVILEGEGFFDVVQKADSPFIVKAGRYVTTVLGTSFNIKAYKGEATVAITVASGKIQVQDEHKRKTVLTSNRQITLAEQPVNDEVVVERTVKATAYNAWIEGTFETNNGSFEEIANTLGRRYNVTFYFEQESLKKCTFMASFDSTATLPRILGLLCRINNSTYRISEDNKEVYISGEGCHE